MAGLLSNHQSPLDGFTRENQTNARRRCQCFNCKGRVDCACACFECRAPRDDEAGVESLDHVINLKLTFVCFPCRRMVKRSLNGGVDVIMVGDLVHSGHTTWPFDCPQCKTRLKHQVGTAFEMPKKSDDKAWRQKAKLAGAGYSFSPCDCFKEQNEAALKKLGVGHPSEVKA